MIRAVWNGTVLAETSRTVEVEDHHYFPPYSLRREFLIESPRTSICPWKGVASYYSVVVNGEVNADAAWCYRRPSPLAQQITNYVAFRKGVKVEGEAEADRRGWVRRFAAWLGE